MLPVGPIRALLLLAALAAPGRPTALAQTTAADSLDVLLLRADSLHYRGDLAGAHHKLAKAAVLLHGHELTAAQRARFWILRGSILVSQTTAENRGYEEADTAAIRALSYAEQSQDQRLLAGAHDLAGRVLYSRRINLDQGDYDRPFNHFQRALSLRRQIKDTCGIVESLFRVGLVHERRNQDSTAIATYQSAWKLAGHDCTLERSHLARHLAYQHRGRGELDRALRLFQKSLALREKAGFVLTRAPALTSIADTYRAKQQNRLALDYGRRALDAAEELQARRFMVMALISLGQTHLALSQRESAEHHLRRAESLATEIGYVSGQQEAQERLAQLAER